MLVGVSLLLLAAGALALAGAPDAAPVGLAAGLTAGAFAAAGAFAVLWGGAHVYAASLLGRWQPAGRILALSLALVNLLVLPFGTLFGIYALWVLLSPGGRHLFEGPPTGSPQHSPLHDRMA